MGIMYNEALKIIGVDRDATKAQIRKAYIELALKWHPDKNMDNKEVASEKFKKIKDAYDLLYQVASDTPRYTEPPKRTPPTHKKTPPAYTKPPKRTPPKKTPPQYSAPPKTTPPPYSAPPKKTPPPYSAPPKTTPPESNSHSYTYTKYREGARHFTPEEYHSDKKPSDKFATWAVIGSSLLGGYYLYKKLSPTIFKPSAFSTPNIMSIYRAMYPNSPNFPFKSNFAKEIIQSSVNRLAELMSMVPTYYFPLKSLGATIYYPSTIRMPIFSNRGMFFDPPNIVFLYQTMNWPLYRLPNVCIPKFSIADDVFKCSISMMYSRIPSWMLEIIPTLSSGTSKLISTIRKSGSTMPSQEQIAETMSKIKSEEVFKVFYSLFIRFLKMLCSIPMNIFSAILRIVKLSE